MVLAELLNGLFHMTCENFGRTYPIKKNLSRSTTGAEQDVLPHRAGAEHAAAPAALRAAPPRQARLQAHQGRRGHLQVGFPIPPPKPG